MALLIDRQQQRNASIALMKTANYDQAIIMLTEMLASTGDDNSDIFLDLRYVAAILVSWRLQ